MRSSEHECFATAHTYTVLHPLSSSTVKLIKNFRSHPAILKFPNEQFYDGELQSCGNPEVINSLARWDGLATPGLPLIFHGIAGSLFLATLNAFTVLKVR